MLLSLVLVTHWSRCIIIVIISKGQHLKHYNSIAIMLHYIFALSYNALTLWRTLSLLLVIALSIQELLSLLTVIALSFQISIIASISYRISYLDLLFNSSNVFKYSTRRRFQVLFLAK